MTMSRHSYFEFTGPFLTNYDRFNHLATFSLDCYWRRVTANKAANHMTQMSGEHRALDLACGTGDMAAALHRRTTDAVILGSDPSAEMLALARKKKQRLDWQRFFPIRAAGPLPLQEESVQVITCAFGVRNFIHLREDMQQCQRILQFGGRIYLLDFYKPENIFSRSLLFLFKVALAPVIGGLLTGQIKPYRYLMASMHAFRTPEEMDKLLQEIGLHSVEIHSFFFALVHLVIAEKI